CWHVAAMPSPLSSLTCCWMPILGCLLWGFALVSNLFWWFVVDDEIVIPPLKGGNRGQTSVGNVTSCGWLLLWALGMGAFAIVYVLSRLVVSFDGLCFAVDLVLACYYFFSFVIFVFDVASGCYFVSMVP
ncbi:hypothetical protein U1Q18_022745, partial [Sarracenia purpurea var. burkii]